MKSRPILGGLAIGLVLGIPLAALFHLGQQLGWTTFVPFDIFDWHSTVPLQITALGAIAGKDIYVISKPGTATARFSADVLVRKRRSGSNASPVALLPGTRRQAGRAPRLRQPFQPAGVS